MQCQSEKPLSSHPRARLARRSLLWLALAVTGGCTAPFLNDSPRRDPLASSPEEPSLRLVGDFAGPWGLNYKKIESVALVTNLDFTGSDPPPDSYRNYLLGEMQGREVKDPQQLLASERTSLVLLTAYLPPNVQKGDAIDVEVYVPPKSTTASLRGGWLMPARLRELASFRGQIRRGSESGLAQGNVVVDSIFAGDRGKTNEVRGLVPGGGVSLETRKLGLRVRRDDVSIETTSVIGAAVNARFHTYDRGVKRGVAEPKNDHYVELLVPPRYRQNLVRYVSVVRAIPLRESPLERQERLLRLEQELLTPESSAAASLSLEAIGRDATSVLNKGLASSDVQVRFHAAEALSYLDVPAAAPVLTLAARQETAFRRAALAALGSMDHVQAYEGLSSLLHVTSAETRYGAFRTLRLRNPSDPLVKGEKLGDQCYLHVIPTDAEPLVHVSRSERPEIVLFGQEIPLLQPRGLFAGKEIMVTSPDSEQIKISRFAPGEEDRIVYTDTNLASVVRAIVETGGKYGDVVEFLHEAKKNGHLEARVAVDALPKADRVFYRDDSADKANGNDEATGTVSLSNLPESADLASEIEETYVAPEFSPETKRGFWSRMMPWWNSDK
jgi:flagellar basal body P-ring protein FlgI